MDTITKSVSSKVDRDATTSTQHVVTFEADVDMEVILADAARTWAIEFQRRFRENPSDYPAGAVTVKVSSLKTRRVTTVSKGAVANFLAAMSEEDREEFLASVASNAE